MNGQEILTFTDLYIKFQEQCRHVAEILSEYDCDFKESCDNIWKIDYAVSHDENKFDCYTEIVVYTMNEWAKLCTLSFPAELLSADDSQIHVYAQEKYKK